jgi:iron complex outermembrane receptor protein
LIEYEELEDTTWAGYVQDELSITHALTITAGVRYDHYDIQMEGKMEGSDSWEQNKGSFSPNLGATYSICDELNLFAGFNSAYKSPVRLPKVYISGSLTPERLNAYEVGARGFMAGWLDYNLAVFWSIVNDKFVRPSSDADATYENAGETRSRGVELGVNAKLPHGFYASTNFTWQDSEFVEFVSEGVDYSGNKINGAPDVMLSFRLGYRNDLLGDISLNPVYTGTRYFNYANTLEEDGFWVLNARYAKKFGQVEFYVIARNIFDEQAVATNSGSPVWEYIYPYPGFNAFAGVNIEF